MNVINLTVFRSKTNWFSILKCNVKWQCFKFFKNWRLFVSGEWEVQQGIIILLFSHLPHMHLLSTYHVPGTAISSECTLVPTAFMVPDLMELTVCHTWNFQRCWKDWKFLWNILINSSDTFYGLWTAYFTLIRVCFYIYIFLNKVWGFFLADQDGREKMLTEIFFPGATGRLQTGIRQNLPPYCVTLFYSLLQSIWLRF